MFFKRLSAMHISEKTMNDSEEVVQPTKKGEIESKDEPQNKVITLLKVDKPIINSAAQAPTTVLALLEPLKNS